MISSLSFAKSERMSLKKKRRRVSEREERRERDNQSGMIEGRDEKMEILEVRKREMSSRKMANMKGTFQRRRLWK
jgi:hypothetical protein